MGLFEVNEKLIDMNACLFILSENLEIDVLRILAEKSKKEGINDVIRQYQGLL